MVGVWGGVCVAVRGGVAVGRVEPNGIQKVNNSVIAMSDNGRKSLMRKY